MYSATWRLHPGALISYNETFPVNVAPSNCALRTWQVGFGQVQVDAGPEDCHCLGFEVGDQDALGGQSNLEFLAALLVVVMHVLGGVLTRCLIVRWGVRHPQVGADHIHDGLPLGGVVLR
jgi:hypothetical protein